MITILPEFIRNKGSAMHTLVRLPYWSKRLDTAIPVISVVMIFMGLVIPLAIESDDPRVDRLNVNVEAEAQKTGGMRTRLRLPVKPSNAARPATRTMLSGTHAIETDTEDDELIKEVIKAIFP